MENKHLATCPVCQQYEQEAKAVTERLNQAREIGEKSRYASELLELEKMLLNCTKYGADDPECQAHKQIVNLRRKTAKMILKLKP